MPLTETVIFTVQIVRANKGAWYHDSIGTIVDCLLCNATLGHHGPEICYRVTGHFETVKYIKIAHAEVLSQRLATQSEVLKKYPHK